MPPPAKISSGPIQKPVQAVTDTMTDPDRGKKPDARPSKPASNRTSGRTSNQTSGISGTSGRASGRTPAHNPEKRRKMRLDALVLERSLAESRRRAQALIMSGSILVDDIPVDKPGAQVSRDAVITSRADDLRYASRGGLKLEHALAHFRIDPNGAHCLDVGASTGGFTDCLLQHGAASVCAVDVGYGQLSWKLRQDERVRVIERTNIRHVKPGDLPGPFDLIVIDVSFISLEIVVPVAAGFLRPGGRIVALVKPQFEVGKGEVGKGGVVRDASLHEAVIERLEDFFTNRCGLFCRGTTPSPVTGPKGNKEFLMLLNS